MGLFSSRSSKTATDEVSDSSPGGPAGDGERARTAGVDRGARAAPGGAPAVPNVRPTRQSSAASSKEGSTHSAKRSRATHDSKGEKSMANIGQSIVFKGELSGDEDLEIDGQVEGTVQLTNNELTVGANGQLKAEVNAKSIVVIGRVQGNLTATERIEIQATGIVDGDIRAPRLLIQEGAVLNGGIDMSKGGSAAKTAPGAPATSKSETEAVRQSA